MGAASSMPAAGGGLARVYASARVVDWQSSGCAQGKRSVKQVYARTWQAPDHAPEDEAQQHLWPQGGGGAPDDAGAQRAQIRAQIRAGTSVAAQRGEPGRRGARRDGVQLERVAHELGLDDVADHHVAQNGQPDAEQHIQSLPQIPDSDSEQGPTPEPRPAAPRPAAAASRGRACVSGETSTTGSGMSVASSGPTDGMKLSTKWRKPNTMARSTWRRGQAEWTPPRTGSGPRAGWALRAAPPPRSVRRRRRRAPRGGARRALRRR